MHTEAKKRPLTPDEVAALDNVSPSEPIPKDIAELFANRRVTLSPRGSEFDPKRCLVQIAGEQAAWSIEVPENAVLGLMGSSAERLDPTSQPERPVGEDRIKAFRPPWAIHVFHRSQRPRDPAPGSDLSQDDG